MEGDSLGAGTIRVIGDLPFVTGSSAAGLTLEESLARDGTCSWWLWSRRAWD